MDRAVGVRIHLEMMSGGEDGIDCHELLAFALSPSSTFFRCRRYSFTNLLAMQPLYRRALFSIAYRNAPSRECQGKGLHSYFMRFCMVTRPK